MTIAFPDISSYEAGLTIQPGTVAVIAKATEGTYYRDAQYATFKAQAAHVGAVFSAYHFLKAGNGAGQADYCHAMVGSTPVMLDVETEGASKPTTADCLAFINRMHALGGRVWGAYFPAWFWQQVGGSLASLGVAVVSSNYTAYSDSGPGWAPYGGATPVIWQYTNAQSYGGQTVDFNAYKGTVQQLAALINGTTTPIPTPTPEGADVTPEENLWLTNLYSGMFLGGSSCGSNTPAGKNGLFAHVEYITSMLQDLTGRPATPPTPPVDVAALVKAVTDAVAAVIQPAVMAAIPPAQADVENAIAEAVVAHFGIQVVAK